MADHPLIEALEEVLQRERQGLLAGDLDRVLRLAARKEQLLRKMPALRADGPTLLRLQGAATANGRLLAAAARGVRAASERLRMLAEGPAPLTTYDDTGRRRTLGSRQAAVIHRA